MSSRPPLLGSDFPLPLDLPFTSAQALDAGVSRHRLRRLVLEGFVRRLTAGVYVAAQAEDSQLLRARAIALVVPRDAVVTDEAAGWLTGARMILPPGSHRSVPPLTIFSTGRGRRLRNGLCSSGTRDLLSNDLTEVHGVLMTTPLRTALDLGRLRRRDRALAAMDSLLALGDFTQEELLTELPRFKGFRGVRQLRVLAPLTDGRSESPGESALRLRFHDALAPAPVTQYDVIDDAGRWLGRADLAIPEIRFIGEYDGERWHGPERAAEDQRRRDAFVKAGWTVRVFRSANVFGPGQDAIETIRSGVRDARANLGVGRTEMTNA